MRKTKKTLRASTDAGHPQDSVPQGKAGLSVSKATEPSDRQTVPIEDAIHRLGNRTTIHTFMQTGPMVIGADHDREELIAKMRRYGVEESGDGASQMGHTLVIVAYPVDGQRTTPLFIEAKAEGRS